VFAAGNTSEMISNEQLTQFFELPVQVNWENSRPFISRLQMQV
jgi:iron complex transport system ATP-binding protein